MDHSDSCGCALCVRVRCEALPIVQADRDALADAWAQWRSTDDGEVKKLRAGENGNPGSPRWVALQAIARARLAAERVLAMLSPVSQDRR